ncbi:hypothetical protein JG688_00008240 [Phytophthora aleatoria]|uniref:RxLR effector protein n=1 Tax=Phytophthora aleatoria TaxID=2496075 RepID=A0A8J5IRB8_9STRA|nr:hypothetical protein JG688_00008240 [Phytophthora aleatoria]
MKAFFFVFASILSALTMAKHVPGHATPRKYGKHPNYFTDDIRVLMDGGGLGDDIGNDDDGDAGGLGGIGDLGGAGGLGGPGGIGGLGGIGDAGGLGGRGKWAIHCVDLAMSWWMTAPLRMIMTRSSSLEGRWLVVVLSLLDRALVAGTTDFRKECHGRWTCGGA